MKPPELSIIVTSFDTKELTLECLDSVFANTNGCPYEVIVVDNGSSDGSAEAIAERYPQVKLLALGENLGFARANNVAGKSATGEYVLLLNPDTVVLGQAIQNLLAFAKAHPDAGISGGRTLFRDRTLNTTSCFGMPTPRSMLFRALGLSALFRGNTFFDPESLGRWRRDSVRQVDVIAGCLLLMRRELWNEVGGFDEDFFMYGEDVDLSMRVIKQGWKCYVCPDAEIIHLGGGSVKVRSARRVNLFQAKALLFYKHWSPPLARFGVWTLDMWALTRTIGWWFRSRGDAESVDDYVTWRDTYKRRREWRGRPPTFSPA